MSVASKLLMGLLGFSLGLPMAQAKPSGRPEAHDRQGRPAGERRVETPSQRGREGSAGGARPASPASRSGEVRGKTSQGVSDLLAGQRRARSPATERVSRTVRERAQRVLAGRRGR